MLFIPVLGLVLASITPVVYSQLPLEQAQQILIGTWSSGSQRVLTGPGFANPANQSFTYPPTTGISYSFTDTYYELSRYRFISNGSDPTCITGVIGWSHGKYQLNTNGSMTLVPFPDGYQQIQDPCAAVSNFIEDYRVTEELYVQWAIFVDPTFGPKLHLNQFDGAPLAPMFQVSPQPNMLPTQQLRNVSDPNADSDSNVQRRGLSNSGALSSRRVDNVMTTGVSGLIVAAFASLAL